MNLEYRMLTEVRSEEAKRIRRETKDRDFSPRRGKVLVPRNDQLVQAVTTSLTKDHYVLVTQRSTSTHHQYMKGTSQEQRTMETLPRSTQKSYPTLTALSVASLAKHLASQANDEASTIQEVRSFLTSHGFLGKSNHAVLSLRTSRACYLTTKGAHSLPSLPRLMNWGTTVNGKCLTARISVSHKTENGLSLSDILEEHPDLKYFLSAETAEKILTQGKSNLLER